MKYCFIFLYAVCRALLQKDLKVYFIAKNEKDVRPTVYFKNGSYIKTIVPEEDNCRGKRASIIEYIDGNAPSKEEIEEVLNNLKV